MNIVLIGMPGCGKSTVGVVLAKCMGYHFLDSDILIQKKYGKLLRELIDEMGEDGFKQIENDVNKAIDTDNTVIATGGSAVYGEEAMLHLKKNAVFVYIEVPSRELDNRVRDFKKRGVITNGLTTMQDIYNDRVSLYEKYADIVIHENGSSVKKIERVVHKIMARIDEYCS